MSDYITLIGAEQVTQAGRNISGAADTISRAAESFDWSVTRLERILSEFADRMETIHRAPEPEPVVMIASTRPRGQEDINAAAIIDAAKRNVLTPNQPAVIAELEEYDPFAE